MFWKDYYSCVETTTVLQEVKTPCVCAVRTAVTNESSHLFCYSVMQHGSFLMYSRFYDVPNLVCKLCIFNNVYFDRHQIHV